MECFYLMILLFGLVISTESLTQPPPRFSAATYSVATPRGWRLATMAEATQWSNTVKRILKTRGKWVICKLKDGNVRGHGYSMFIDRTYKGGYGCKLLIYRKEEADKIGNCTSPCAPPYNCFCPVDGRESCYCKCRHGFGGRNCSVQVISTCGGTISHHKFQIKYPLTGLYEAGKRCIWSTDFYFPLFVKNVFMDLEKSRYCKYDYVSIKSKYSTITPKKYCGNTRIRNPSVRGLVVEFHSDGSANRKGFRINGIVDECALAPICDINANCRMTFNHGPICSCKTGYKGDGITCQKRNCNIECHKNASCQEKSGIDICICNVGFHGNGTYCKDLSVFSSCGGVINATLFQLRYPASGLYRNNEICSWQINTSTSIKIFFNRFQLGKDDFLQIEKDSDLGKFYGTDLPPNMASASGRLKIKFKSNSIFSGLGFVMTAVKDLCQTSENKCPTNSTCIMGITSYTCVCLPGFGGIDCTDVNECLIKAHRCHQNASCINTIGNYSCLCDGRFNGDGFLCIEFCPANINKTCNHERELCMKMDSVWTCICKSKYIGANCEVTLFSDCGGRVTSIASQIKYPRFGRYRPRTRCIWIIDVAEPVSLEITKMDIEEDVTKCSHDSLKISFIDRSYTYCGSQKANLVQQNGSAEVEFISDSDTQHYGFTLIINRDLCQNYTCADSNSYCIVHCRNISCLCSKGFEKSSASMKCRDIDECDPELRPKRHNCHQQAKCNNTIGSFTCHCKAGYDGDGVKNCIEFCPAHINDTCLSNRICKKIQDQWKCVCISQYVGEKCDIRSYSACGGRISSLPSQIKYPLTGRYKYSMTCIWDINVDAPLSLEISHMDVESDGGKCIYDYVRFVIKGKRYDYCAYQTPSLAVKNGRAEVVFKSDGGVNRYGFTMNINEDLCQNYSCSDLNASCFMRNRIPVCKCKSGYKKGNDSTKCLDIDECNQVEGSKNLHNCHQYATCNNTMGSFNCHCKAGFAGDGVLQCKEFCPAHINETCLSNQVCSKIQDQWNCVCISSYIGEKCDRKQYSGKCNYYGINIKELPAQIMYAMPQGGKTRVCNWILETRLPVEIYVQKFIFSQEYYKCKGYVEIQTTEKYKKLCGNVEGTSLLLGTGDRRKIKLKTNYYSLKVEFIININENVCLTQKDICSASHQMCVYSKGKASCVCIDGFTRNGTEECQDIDECQGSYNCHFNATCQNTAGSYQCVCKNGYSGDGISCIELCPDHVNASCDYSKEICQKVDSQWGCYCNSYTKDTNCRRVVFNSCGGIINQGNVIIKYKFVKIYGSRIICTWDIRPGVPVFLKFLKLNLGRYCDMNYVTISSKSHSETICGSKKIQWLLSQKWNAITVKYVSYGRYIDGGDFDLSISIDPCYDKCSENTLCTIGLDGKPICKCKDGYIENGKYCYANRCTLCRKTGMSCLQEVYCKDKIDVIRQFKLTYLNNYVLSNGWELASLKDVQNTRNERSIKNHLYGQKSIVKIADGTLRYINRKLFISKFFIPDGKYMYHLLAKDFTDEIITTSTKESSFNLTACIVGVVIALCVIVFVIMCKRRMSNDDGILTSVVLPPEAVPLNTATAPPAEPDAPSPNRLPSYSDDLLPIANTGEAVTESDLTSINNHPPVYNALFPNGTGTMVYPREIPFDPNYTDPINDDVDVSMLPPPPTYDEAVSENEVWNSEV